MLFLYTTKAGIFLVLLTMGGFGLFAQDAGLRGSISGRGVDADTRAPLADVRVGSRETGYATTDSEGRYILRDAPSGQWRIRILEVLPGATAPIILAPTTLE